MIYLKKNRICLFQHHQNPVDEPGGRFPLSPLFPKDCTLFKRILSECWPTPQLWPAFYPHPSNARVQHIRFVCSTCCSCCLEVKVQYMLFSQHCPLKQANYSRTSVRSHTLNVFNNSILPLLRWHSLHGSILPRYLSALCFSGDAVFVVAKNLKLLFYPRTWTLKEIFKGEVKRSDCL